LNNDGLGYVDEIFLEEYAVVILLSWL